MKRASRAIFLLALAALAGAAASEAVYRSSATRGLLARMCSLEKETLTMGRHLRASAEQESVSDGEIERALNLLRAQFGDQDVFLQALASSHLSLGTIRAEVVEHLRAQRWVEKQIASQLGATEEEARQFYEMHPGQFLQPRRYRANHLFLAAPVGSTPELIAGKQSAIQGLAIRLLAGESLAQLAAEGSEDEATRVRGGDLGYFAAARMPARFFEEVEKLQPEAISAPFRSHLGFHLVQLSQTKPARKLSFEEARPEIALGLENEKRASAVRLVRESLNGR